MLSLNEASANIFSERFFNLNIIINLNIVRRECVSLLATIFVIYIMLNVIMIIMLMITMVMLDFFKLHV